MRTGAACYARERGSAPRRALAEVLRDEPGYVELLSVVAVEEVNAISPN